MDKSLILQLATERLRAKQGELLAMLDDLNNGIANETKSSAGDKYETSRSMSQQEIDKVSVQLAETKRQLALLPQLESAGTPVSVQNGSLVVTASGNFFIGIPLGQLEIEGEIVFCISPTAPLAQVMLGKSAKESYSFQGKANEIIQLI